MQSQYNSTTNVGVKNEFAQNLEAQFSFESLYDFLF